MGSTNPHRLGQLSEADCWLLFRNIAFSGKSKEETEKLEGIGRELARKCKGVPLAVKTLASSMRFIKKIEEWRAVLDSDMWRVRQQHKDGFLPSLMFSYLALTPSLKLCFLYCAVFSKNSRLEKDELVKQWMAQGFLEGDELEMIGAENFDILASRSLFQNFQEGSNGSIVSCYMHDLVHDFCQFLASGELRDMTVSDLNDLYNSSNVIGKKIRTLKFTVFPKSIPSQVFNQLTSLRTLVMCDCDIQELPGEVVGGLLHLRYLDLSSNEDLRELPETVCNLLNLQTLKLKWCRSLCKLPEGIGKLHNLRYLEIKNTNELKYFPRSIGKLRKLRTLSKLSVSGMDGGCGIGELRNLNHLQGTLSLIGLRHVNNSDEAKRAELHKKRNLNCLQFGEQDNMRHAPEEGEIEPMEDVFESLRPNVNLEVLKIDGYPCIKFPAWMVSPLSKVVKLALNDCYNCQTLPGLGQLQFLETLKLESFWSMKHIGAEFYGVGAVTSFPKLKKLTFWSLEKVETWEIPFPKYEKVMPSLQSLEVSLCPKLKGLPSLGRLESLETIEINCLPSMKVGTELLGMSSDSSGKESNKNMTSSGGGDYVKQPTAVKHVSAYLLGNSDGESTTSASSSSVVLFPRLTFLSLYGLPKWEEGEHAMDNDASIMPCLRILSIRMCPKLKVVPYYMFSQSLRKLELSDCPQLTGTQHCLPPLLEEISFYGDVGVLSTSLLPVIDTTTTYPNLKIVRIFGSPHFSLPEGLNQLTSLEELIISYCASLELKLEELPHLPKLKNLGILGCPLIPERCRGEEWRSILTRPKQLRNHLFTA